MQPTTTITVPNSTAADGVYMHTNGPALTANISGTTITNNSTHDPSLGINMVIGGGAGSATLNLSGTNSVELSKGTGTLINVKGSGNGTTNITGNFNLTNHSNNESTYDGVETTTQGGGTATLNMQSTGTVSVKGGNGLFIDSLSGGGNVVGDIGSGVTVVLDNTTSGGSSLTNAGIRALTQNQGTINLTTRATVNTTGNRADGISAEVGRGAIGLTNYGTVTTSGLYSHGIEAYGSNATNPAGLVTVENHGNIETKGLGTTNVNTSMGIYVHTTTTGAAAAGNIDLTNSGELKTAGSYANGIRATSTTSSSGAAGSVTVGNSGDITTAGSFANGIDTSSTSSSTGNTGAVAVTNSGGIATQGSNAIGIQAKASSTNGAANAGTVSVTNSGDITTHGNTANAIWAENSTNNAAGNPAGTVAVENHGNIATMSSDASVGIYVRTTAATSATAGEIALLNTGTIATHGSDAHGIEATSGAFTGTAGAVTVRNSGDITTRGSTANSIWANSNSSLGKGGAIRVENDGILATQGISASGILADNTTNNSNTAGSLFVDNSGRITTQGSSAVGIHALSSAYNTGAAGSIDVTNRGGIETWGKYAAAILAESSAATSLTAAASSVSVTSEGKLTTHGADAIGIDAQSVAEGGTAGKVSVTSQSGIITNGNGSIGLRAWSRSETGAAGEVEITNHGDIVTNGLGLEYFSTFGSIGLRALSESLSGAAGKVSVTNDGDIATFGAQALGIDALSRSTSGTANEVSVTNTGGIATQGNAAAAIWAESATGTTGLSTGNVSVANSGDIATFGADNAIGILGISAKGGNVTLISIGADIVTAGQGVGNHGMEARADNGLALIEFSGGTVRVAGQSSALAAWNNNSALASSARVTMANAVVDATRTFNQAAIQAWAITGGEVNIDAASQVHGGWNNNSIGGGWGTPAVMTGGALQTIANNGLIDAMSERAIVGDTLRTGTLNIANNGLMTGSVTAQTSITTLINNNTWNLRNVADTDGDGIRDTLAVAVSDLGTSGSNIVVNNGRVALFNAPATTIDHTGEYNTGYAVNTLALNGAVQAHLLGLATFVNNGVVDMGDANGAVGDVLWIAGDYVSGGRLLIDTVLNEGGPNSQSDMLVANSTSMGNGPTFIGIKNVGGAGAQTVGDGIELVRVLNSGQSAPDIFRLDSRVVAGLYEYDLYQGGIANSADGNWYLRTLTLPGPDGGGGAFPIPAQRPEPYLYVRNMAAATGMFLHTLHDRLGEPQFTETYGNNNKDNKVPAVWGRIVASSASSESAGGRIDLDTDTSLVHIGGDIARWTRGENRYHLGIMGAYGKSDTTAQATDLLFTPSGFSRRATGDVKGYGLGVYGTWYGNDTLPTGPYIDAWAMFNWFDNAVEGSSLPKETYNSQGQIVSIEGGYAFIVHDGEKRQWMIEPQAQLAYTLYSEDDHREVNGTRVDNDDGNGVITRLGARFYSRSKLDDNGMQPFIEANWWHGTASNSLDFNGTTVSDGAPESRYELKIGLQSEIARRWQVWGHVGGQWGEDSYDRYEGMVGLKYVF